MLNDENQQDESEGFHDEPMATTTRRRSRRGNGKVTETTITKRELNEGNDDDDAGMTFAALFDAGPDDGNTEKVVRIRVNRADPKEGFLGYIDDMEATEAAIKDQWGGSTYRLDGVNLRGRIVRVRTIMVAGDPIFVGEAFEANWRRMRGLPKKDAGQSGDQLSAREMIELMDAREAALRKELADKEEASRKAREEREAERRRDEREWQLQREREQREWDERQRRERDEADRRRRQDDEEREARRRRDNEEAAARQAQFMTQMLTSAQSQANQMIAFVKETVAANAAGPKTDGSEMLIKGVQLAMQLRDAAGGESEEDLLTTVVKNLPQMLNSAGNAVGKAVREIKGAPGAPAQASHEGGLTLPPGPVSAKFSELVNRISAAGGDPEKTLDALADRLLTSAPKKAEAPTGPRATVFDPGPTSSSGGDKAPGAELGGESKPQGSQGGGEKAPRKVERLKFGK